MLPLYALAGGLVNATVDALFLYGPDGAYLVRAIPPALALLLGAGALVVSTAYLTGGELKEEQLKPWIVGPPVVLVAAILWLAGSSQLAGIVVLAALIAYTIGVRKAGRLWALTLSLIAGAALLFATLAEPIETGRGIGAIGAIGTTVAALVTITVYLVRLFGLVEIPARVREHVPFDHVPVLTIIGVWMLVAVLIAPATAHDVQLSAAPPATASGVDVDDAVSAWWAAQPESSGTAAAGTSVPLVLVAAEGGGLRASYWTGGVLDVLAKGPDPARRLESVPDTDPVCDRNDATGSGRTFLVSGASGGSVGAYAYAQELAKRGCLAPGWYARWFARDVLGPTVSWGLLHDTFATMFHQRPGTGGTCRFGDSWICQVLEDRARILEGSLDFDASARDIGLRSATFAAPTPVPHLVFNTSADDVRERVELSTLQLEPRAGVVADGLDAHCTEGDLPLVTAAVLSARFPVVTSAGRIACAHRSVVDGGYLENTGVAAIAEVLPRLTAAVQKQNTANVGGGTAADPDRRGRDLERAARPAVAAAGRGLPGRRAEAALRAARPAVAAELPDRGRSRRTRAGRGRRLRGGRRHRPRHGAAAARGRLEGVGRLAALARRSRRAGVGPRRGRTADQPGNGRRAAGSVVRERRAVPAAAVVAALSRPACPRRRPARPGARARMRSRCCPRRRPPRRA